MEQSCSNSNCRKQLREYRESTSKLYGEIDSLEDDLKDRDDFSQKIIRQRNQLQEEVSFLKKKNSELQNENDELVEKVNQLDEDTDAGVEMLQMAHERERKNKIELKELKDKVIRMKELEKEKEQLSSKFQFVKNKLEECLKQNQEAIISKDDKIKELESSLSCEKSLENKADNAVIDVNEKKIKEQALVIKTLQNEKFLLEKKNVDLIDESEMQKVKVIELEQFIEKKASANSSASSLSDELKQVQVFQCHKCDNSFVTHEDLKKHQKHVHDAKQKRMAVLQTKMNNIAQHLSEQKMSISSSILQFQKKEISLRQSCTCKSYCRIFHTKHNFVKSKSNELFSKLKNISSSDAIYSVNQEESNNFGTGALRKSYPCNKCEKGFTKQGLLKKHMKMEHRARREEFGEV